MTVTKGSSRKSATENLEAARAVLAETNAKLDDLGQRRNAALVASTDDAQVAAIDKMVEELRRTAKIQSDRIVLLGQQAAQEEAERQAKEKAEQIERVEALLSERDAVGAELAAAIAKADELFRKTIELSKAADAAWPFPTADRIPCLLLSGSILVALQHEIYRVGARPLLYGGQDRERGTELSLPGGKSPSHELTGVPSKIPPLVEVLKAGSAHASAIMRGARAPTPPRAEQLERTPTQTRLAALLAEQNRLGTDDSPEGEQRYQAVISEIATLQA